ncbi:MAG: SAM-dependent chlorinase/fluorinase [Candidatus Omnitrophica bacterium]|nr:SAM-dependent chlorinase/fluorinase [Candidatus Omnitrophota bacterium]
MKIIALLTDFGLKDQYAGLMKAVILGINPKARIVDISHNVRAHDIKEAAFLLSASFKYFPRRSIFVVVVDPGVGSERRPIIIKTKNYYFIGPDNGVLSLAAREDGIKAVRAVENKNFFLSKVSSTFHGRDIFAPAAAYFLKGRPFACFGRQIRVIKEISFPQPKISKSKITAEVIHADRFGNLVTNMKEKHLKGFGPGEIKASMGNKKITRKYSTYAQARPGEPFFITGSSGFLEISLKNKSAKEFFKIKNGSNHKIIVEVL